MSPLVLGIAGASGAAYAVRLLEQLAKTGHDIDLVISQAGEAVLKQELKVTFDRKAFDWKTLFPTHPQVVSAYAGWTAPEANPVGKITLHELTDYSAGIASGSYRTTGMVICPCSMDTLGRIACGLSGNLIQRAASVHIKERRPLILVPRETPLSVLHLDNMHTLAAAGCVVLPAMPGLYHDPTSLMDAIDFIVARILDQLGIDASLMTRWGNTPLD